MLFPAFGKADVPPLVDTLRGLRYHHEAQYGQEEQDIHPEQAAKEDKVGHDTSAVLSCSTGRMEHNRKAADEHMNKL